MLLKGCVFPGRWTANKTSVKPYSQMIISDVKIGIFHHFQLSPFFQKSQDSQSFPNGFVIVNGLLQHSKTLKNHNVGQSLEWSENGVQQFFCLCLVYF